MTHISPVLSTRDNKKHVVKGNTDRKKQKENPKTKNRRFFNKFATIQIIQKHPYI